MSQSSNQATPRLRSRQILKNLTPKQPQRDTNTPLTTDPQHNRAPLPTQPQPTSRQNPTPPTTQRSGASSTATIVGYSAVALAVLAVIIGGFIEGFHVSSYGLASILGFLAVIRVLLSNFTAPTTEARSPWIDATVMATSAIILITLTAGIPLDQNIP